MGRYVAPFFCGGQLVELNWPCRQARWANRQSIYLDVYAETPVHLIFLLTMFLSFQGLQPKSVHVPGGIR